MCGTDIADAKAMNSTCQQNSKRFTKKYLFGQFDMIVANCHVLYMKTTMIKYPMIDNKKATIEQIRSLNSKPNGKCDKTKFIEMICDELIPILRRQIWDQWWSTDGSRKLLNKYSIQERRKFKTDGVEWNFRYPTLNPTAIKLTANPLPQYYNHSRFKTVNQWKSI